MLQAFGWRRLSMLQTYGCRLLRQGTSRHINWEY